MEFYNAANRLYVFHFIEVVEMGDHRVLYCMLRLADGKRGGAPDKEVGRMVVAILAQYLEENPDDLICFSHNDNNLSNAINRIYHLWGRANRDLYDGKGTFFDGTGHDAEGHSMHFMVMYHFDCKDIAELKAFILENSDEFAVSVREQIVLLHDIEEQMHESDDAV